jgi:predicted nucleotidyltransferase
MIEIHKTNNLLEKGFFNFEYSKEFLTETDSESLRKVKGLGFYFKDDDIESTGFNHFFKNFNKILIDENNIYFVLTEIYPKKRNRVRSKRLMFYEERKEIGEENVLETEVEFKDDETIIAGAAKLAGENFDYCPKNLLNEYFSFGYIINKEKDKFKENFNRLSEKIVKEFSNSPKRFQINYLKLANFLLDEGVLIYRITFDGRSIQSLEIYGLDKEIEELEELVENKLDKVYYLRRRDVPINKNLQTKLVELLQPYHPARIGIFGSYARGENKIGSDLDILIKFRDRISLLKLVQIEQELHDELGIPVDLVTENSLKNPRLKKYIEKDLITIYE